MALRRPTASNGWTSALTLIQGGRLHADPPSLTRAEARALRRSAPLTHARLEEHFEGVRDRSRRG